MTTAAALIDLATGLLEDPGNDVWGRTELLGYLNDALKALAEKLPGEFVQIAVLTLAAGTKQTVPAGTVGIIRPVGNIDATETVRGRVIRPVDKALLDAGAPSWMTATPGVTRQLAISPSSDSDFWVSPPAVAGAKIEAEVEVDPTVASQSSTLEVDAKYHPALVDYVVFRALSKDSEYAVDGKAAAFFEKFLNAVSPDAPQ